MANQINGCQDDDITEFEMILNMNHNIMKMPIIRIHTEIFYKTLMNSSVHKTEPYTGRM